MIRCACLLETTGDAIMLVRVRENDQWYLPGGTIEEGETPEQTLVREIDEELNVQIDRSTISLDRVLIGPALGRNGDVELNCYRAKWDGEIQAASEVSEVSFIDLNQKDKMAPAIKILADELQQEQIAP